MADLTPVNNTGKLQKDLVLVIGTGAGAKAYQKHVSNIQFAPSNASPVVWQGGTPDAQLVGLPPAGAWVANISAIQDWDNADSLVRFLFEHQGEDAAIQYKPNRTGTFVVYATITIAAPQIGGPVNAFNESTVACASTRPTTTAPA